MPVRKMERSGEPPAALICVHWEYWEKTCGTGQGDWDHRESQLCRAQSAGPDDNSPVALSAEGLLSRREQNPAFCLSVFLRVL